MKNYESKNICIFEEDGIINLNILNVTLHFTPESWAEISEELREYLNE